LAEQVIFDYILPLPSIATSSATKEKEVDEVSWTDRLLITMRHLSEKSIVVLIGLSGLKSLYVYALFFTTDTDLFIFRRPNVNDVYVESCMQNNVGRHVILDKMKISLLFRVESLTTTRKRL
jgi:sister chromatid cohesion protein PDS5